jgi:hypothetical protein
MLKKSAKLVAVALLALLGIWWLGSYRISQYRGDGKIRDSGMWSYPRYHIDVGQIPLSKSGTYQFKLAGLPPEKMSLELRIPEKTEKDRKELAGLTTKIEAFLLDETGQAVCVAFGVPSDGIQEKAWIFTGSDDFAAFWNKSCLEKDIHHTKSYVLTVKLSEIDSRSPGTYLVPTFSGGGNELP